MTLVGLILAVQPVWAQVSKPLVQADISRLADTAHVEFKGLKNWHYDVQRDGSKKITVSVAPIDEASVARLQAFTDPLVSDVKVNKSGPDGSYQISFHLAGDDVESFDYLTDEPSRLIVDFYRKADEGKKDQIRAETAPAAQGGKSDAKPKAKVAASLKPKNKDGYENHPVSRRPAGDEFLAVNAPAKEESNVALHFGIFDAGDENYDRFRIKDYEVREEAIISSRHNVYLPFPWLKMKVGLLDKLMEQQPEYVIHPKDTKENKEARLLLALFQRKRFGVYMKTYDYFTKKYPESEYMEILKNTTATVHLLKWREEGKSEEYDKARAMYTELVQKFPSSPLREHNYLILGFMQMERGEALASLQTFEGFLKTYPKSTEIPQVRRALAESYMILRKYDEATAEYNAIVRDFPKTEHAQEARYRLGDVQFAKGDYTQAIRAYETAVKDLPAFEKVYPNATYNMAEARFWQKDFKKSLEGYVNFVNLFPTHEYGGYALTRIGELLGVLGADQRRVMGAFLESYFRFPNHPGAKVARIRMLSQQMRGMKEKEEKKALEEINGYSDKLDLPGIKEFTTLMVAEGLTNRGEYKDALANLIAYYQKNPTSANLDSFKSRILRNIANELKTRVEAGEFLQALQFYHDYSKTWLKNSDRIDVPFFVAGAYERAGAYSEAEAIYKDALTKRRRIVGTEEEKEKKVQEHLPSVSSLRLRMAATSMQDRNYMEAYQQLKDIGKGDDLTPPEVIERVRLSAMIAERRNEPEKAREALMELAKKWQGDPALLAPVNLQLAQTFMKLKDPKQAEYYAGRVLAAEGGENKVPEKTLADAYSVKAEALMGQKKNLAAVETYQKMLERFEDKMPLANVRYQAGQILFDAGDLKGASDMWKHLEGTPNDFLYKIGKEKLEDTKWRGDYDKYISRIPAMAEEKKK
ncbi:MAG: tetratricopeptide repeat protein [Bdellovibrionales bacterium]|nr:tetratricopeptide repeat protein [Bdellovibrionales bacterium]